MSYEQFAYTYDRLMRDMPYQQWVQFTKETWALYHLQPKTIVDLGCGTGTTAIQLAIQGYEVIGIDHSEDMLAVAQHKQEDLRSDSSVMHIDWIQQDMREWQSMKPVDAVISLCDCLNYLLEESDIKATFDRTFAGLRSGGVFIFDVHTLEEIWEYADHQPYFLNEDDISYIWTNELDEQKMQIEHDLTIFIQNPDNRDVFARIDERHVQRGYSLPWLAQSLTDAGFVDVRIGADFEWVKPHELSKRAFFACLKP